MVSSIAKETAVTSSGIVEGLKTCELFTSLSEEQIHMLTTSLAAACQIEDYEAGDSVFMQGEYNAKLYVIVGGQVLLQRSVNIGNRTATWPLGLLGKGRAMGWSALLYGPRYVTASAVPVSFTTSSRSLQKASIFS